MEAWPGWSLSPRAAAGMYARIATRLPRLSELAMRGDPGAAIEAIAEAREQAYPLLLVGAVDRLAEVARIGPEPDTPQAAVWALSIGPPETDDWLIPLRADLTGFCRYAEEGFAPPKDADPKARAAINRARAYCGELASQALEKIAAQVDDDWDDHCGRVGAENGKPAIGHEDTCPYNIARAALSQGGGE